MSDLGPLIGPEGFLAGGATWFAGQVLGPSAAAIGENLKVYFQTRLPSIFGVAAEKAKAANIELRPIKPGLLARMVVDASFSEDTEEITEWWANLFVSASLHGDNIHAVFSDMMAMIGPKEALCLKDLVSVYGDIFVVRYNFETDYIGNVDLGREVWLLDALGQSPFDRSRVEEMETKMEQGKLDWPIRLSAWKLPIYQIQGNVAWEMSANPWFESRRLQLEILSRSGIVKFARVDVPVMGQPSWIDTVELTQLGAEFYVACTRVSEKAR